MSKQKRTETFLAIIDGFIAILEIRKINDVIYLGVQYHDTNTATVRKTIMRIHVLANDRIWLEVDNDEDFRMHLDHEGFLIGREHKYVRAEKWESK